MLLFCLLHPLYPCRPKPALVTTTRLQAGKKSGLQGTNVEAAGGFAATRCDVIDITHPD